MTEQAAKLTVKVKLHTAQPAVLPRNAPPARLSKLKVTLGLLVLLLGSSGGYWLWLQWLEQVPQAVAVEQGNTVGQSPQGAAQNAATSAVEATPQTASTAEVTLNDSSVSASSAGDPAVDMVVQNNPQQQESALATDTQLTAESQNPPVTQAATAANNQVTEPANSPSAESVASRVLPEGFSRIVLSATMERLEPGAAIDSLVAQQQIQRLYLFTELKGYAGQQLIHRWSYAGKVQTEALLTIEDSPWRTYSEKWLLPDQLGHWRVEIIDQQQQVLYQHDFQYQ